MTVTLVFAISQPPINETICRGASRFLIHFSDPASEKTPKTNQTKQPNKQKRPRVWAARLYISLKVIICVQMNNHLKPSS